MDIIKKLWFWQDIHEGILTPWILATTDWVDSGKWIDTELWAD